MRELGRFTNESSFKTWEDRYQKNGETYEESLMRVAAFCANTDEEREAFYQMMAENRFFPGGRTMSNCGIGHDLTINNCFTAPMMEDSLSSIFDFVKLGAITHQRGGGIGYDFSTLRPAGTPTSNDAIASGPVSFMEVFNAQTATILQGGRRGANMGVLNVYHPDIEQFIDAKSKAEGVLEHFNLSVMVDDEFIDAAMDDREITLHFPVYDETGAIIRDPEKWKITKTVSAAYLWNKIIRSAYENGEPGVFFYDNLNGDNNLAYIETITHSNPCAEYLAGVVHGAHHQTGAALDSSQYGGACNLGSLMLPSFVLHPFERDHAVFDFPALDRTVHTAVRMLDNIIDKNTFPNQVYRNYQESFRTIGLGATGFADALAMLGLPYDSAEGVQFAAYLFNRIAYTAYSASVELAKEKGSFPFFDREQFLQGGYLQKHLAVPESATRWRELCDNIERYGIRNAKLLSVAPTGTMSIVFGNNCSSGIEPIFQKSYLRKIKIGGQEDGDARLVEVKDYGYWLWERKREELGADAVFGEEVFRTAQDIDVQDHLEMLAAIAHHVDMSVSKTINIPEDYSFEDTMRVYHTAWSKGIKGCTIFRPNAIRKGVLISKDNSSKGDIPSIHTERSELSRGIIVGVDDDLVSIKKTIINGCGKFYLHVDFDEATGSPWETWIDIGSSGGCERNQQFISRLISLALRGGIPIESIIDQALSVHPCTAYISRSIKKGDTSPGTSCPSAIGLALKAIMEKIEADYMSDEKEEGSKEEKEACADCAACESCRQASEEKSAICPECGEPLDFEGGCVVCRGCGWSKCG